MRGMKAFEARPKRQNYRDGGPVRGPGTGTSDEVPDKVPEGTFIMPTDSTQAIGEQALAGMGGGARGMGSVTGEAAKIPVNLSNGEFKLPPEQVHAVGVQALEQMKDATHAPVSPRARGMKPELFFANGGVVDDEQKRLQNQTAMYVQGAQAAAAARPPEPAPAAATPAAPATPSVLQTDPQAASDRAKVGAAWDTVKDVNDSAGRAIMDVATLIPRGVAGAYDSAVVRPMRAAGMNAGFLSPHLVPNGVDPSSMTPFTDQKRMTQGEIPSAAQGMAAVAAPATSAPPAASVAAQPGTPAANAQSNAQPGAQASAAGGALPSPQVTANQIAPGVYQHGRGQYSDQASGMGMPSVFTGQPSAQNLQAAQALSDRSQQESVNRVTARGMGAVGGAGSGPVEPGSFTGGYSGTIGGGSGNMMSRTPEQQRRDAEVQSTSILKSTADRGRAALTGLDALDQQASRNAGSLDVANVREAGDTSRAFMRDQGDTNRALMRETGESARAGGRNQLDSRRLGMEEVAAGYKSREADRTEKLYERYQAAKTPGDRSAIAQQIRDLKGSQEQRDVWAHSPGGQVVDPRTQQLITQPGVIYNRATGETRADGGANRLPPLGENPAVQEIMNNTALSREDRAKQIRALGYK